AMRSSPLLGACRRNRHDLLDQSRAVRCSAFERRLCRRNLSLGEARGGASRPPPMTSALLNGKISCPAKEGAMGGRRSFLAGAGASIFAASASARHAGASRNGGEVLSADVYVGGLVSNQDLPGLSGQLFLNVYLAVENGTGVGTISDPVHPQVNSHVEITESRRHGNDFQLEGAVILATDPARVGQHVSIVASVQ